MTFSFRQLRLVMALAETGSVSGAARRLNVTQPTASIQLKEMRDALGLPLYEVVARKVYMTELGLELAHTASVITAEWDTFSQRVDARKGKTRGSLRVAVVSTAKYFVPRILGDFCQRYPEIDVAFEVLNRDGVVNRLRNNMDDLYVMSMPPTDIALQDAIFMANPLVMIAATSSPWAKRRRLDLTALAEERFILRERGSGTRMAVDQFFKTARFRPNVRLELGSNEAIKESVAAGLGLAIVSQHALQSAHAQDGVAILKLAGFPLASNWHVVHPKSKQLSPIATIFKQYLLGQRQT